MKIYLDINGTIIHRKLEKGKAVVKPASYLKEFLDNALKRHDVYWLSTICNGKKDMMFTGYLPFVMGIQRKWCPI